MAKSYTSPQVKARWNKRNYDRIAILVPKGDKERLQELAEKVYGLSMNGYINMQVRSLLGVTEDAWHPLYRGE